MCRRIVEQSLELYTCSATSSDSEMPEYARNGTVPKAYNELATLMSVTGGPLPPAPCGSVAMLPLRYVQRAPLPEGLQDLNLARRQVEILCGLLQARL